MSEAPNCEIDNCPYMLHARIYVFGERMMAPGLQNVVIHEIFRLACLDEPGALKPIALPRPSDIDTIYQGTTPESSARRMTVDFAAVYNCESWFVSLDLDPALLPSCWISACPCSGKWRRIHRSLAFLGSR